jgi:hypothetical protein
VTMLRRPFELMHCAGCQRKGALYPGVPGYWMKAFERPSSDVEQAAAFPFRDVISAFGTGASDSSHLPATSEPI